MDRYVAVLMIVLSVSRASLDCCSAARLLGLPQLHHLPYTASAPQSACESSCAHSGHTAPHESALCGSTRLQNMHCTAAGEPDGCVGCPVALQDVVVKSQRPGSSSAAAALLAREVSTLQQLAGIPGVPRLLGTGAGAANSTSAIVTQPLGKALSWEEWSCRVTAQQPLHKLVGQLVATLEMSHARGFINRDLHPSKLVIAGSKSSQPQLVIIDWGFAVKCPDGSDSCTAVYEGTIGYASDSVWQQIIDYWGCGEVRVSAADDLVSLVRCMFALMHPAAHEELRMLPSGYAQAAREFWHKVLASRPRWQLAVDAAARADYSTVRELLEWLLE